MIPPAGLGATTFPRRESAIPCVPLLPAMSLPATLLKCLQGYAEGELC